MLAEQHCVCTESGLKNVFSTRYVVGRQTGMRGEGRELFFPPLSKKMAGRNKNQQAPLDSSASFLIPSEVAASASLLLQVSPCSDSSWLPGTQSAPGSTLPQSKECLQEQMQGRILAALLACAKLGGEKALRACSGVSAHFPLPHRGKAWEGKRVQFL